MSRQARAAGTQTGRSAPTLQKRGSIRWQRKRRIGARAPVWKEEKSNGKIEPRAQFRVVRKSLTWLPPPAPAAGGGGGGGGVGGGRAAKVVGVRVSRRYTGYLLFLPFSARDLQRLRIRLTDSLRDESSGERGRDIKW